MNQTDYLTADSFQFSVTHFVLLFLFVYFTWGKKKYQWCFKKEYIYYYCSRRIPHPTKVPPGTVSKLLNKKKRGEFFLWDTKMRQLCSASVQKLYGCDSYCVEAICNSLCEFCVRGLAREIFFSLLLWFCFFPVSIKALLLSTVPYQNLTHICFFFSLNLLIPILFLLQVTKEIRRKPKTL